MLIRCGKWNLVLTKRRSELPDSTVQTDLDSFDSICFACFVTLYSTNKCIVGILPAGQPLTNPMEQYSLLSVMKFVHISMLYCRRFELPLPPSLQGLSRSSERLLHVRSRVAQTYTQWKSLLCARVPGLLLRSGFSKRQQL